MKTRPEAALWQRLKAACGARIDFDRIESATSVGFPDLIASAVYIQEYNPVCFDFYLELKVSKTKKLEKDLWKPTQIAWQTRASRRLRMVYNLVHRPSSSHSFWLWHGRDLLALVTATDEMSVVPFAKSNDLNELMDAIIADHRSKSKDAERQKNLPFPEVMASLV